MVIECVYRPLGGDGGRGLLRGTVGHHSPAVRQIHKSDSVLNISNTVVPLIVLAECFSWHAVITTDYLGNVIENSIWAVTFLLIAGALFRLLNEFHSAARVAIAAAFASVIAYVAFLALIDVPMYFDRWQADQESGKKFSASLPACTM